MNYLPKFVNFHQTAKNRYIFEVLHKTRYKVIVLGAFCCYLDQATNQSNDSSSQENLPIFLQHLCVNRLP